ncbi:K02A2.6-like [Cordylochernes scorpioides]|uniref:K02A2.6-like n=1 Tax=Cordylochernes scorpioides TaxID=51811 RepID=A0ABY6LCH3_9ARAC|nr:K02A2.6-like [Cordylochernes scorpioides]
MVELSELSYYQYCRITVCYLIGWRSGHQNMVELRWKKWCLWCADIKEYSSWPTIPQVYINGEFVGGCDILIQMHQNGSLIEELEKVGLKSALDEREKKQMNLQKKIKMLKEYLDENLMTLNEFKSKIMVFRNGENHTKMLCSEDPICTFCNSKLKNEITHYIFDCSALKEERRFMLKTAQLCASLPSIIDNMTQNKYIATVFYGFHKSISQKKANKETLLGHIVYPPFSSIQTGNATFVRPSELALHGNVAENWRRFKQRLMLYLEATEKATKPDKLKVAILLNFIGEEALEVFNTFHLKEDEAENFDLVINKFDDFCEPKKNVIFERFKFFSATQKDGESIDSFITELKGLSTSCEFESQKDSLIRDRIVYGIQDKALQERLLREPNLTLLKAIEMCKTCEISKQQIKIMQNNQNICQIRKYEKKHSPKQNQESEKEFKCQRCGKSHRAKNCPAWGKRCSKCKKMNHFAAFCKSSAIRSLNDETEETVWSIHEAKVVHTLEWKKSIIVNGKEICFKLDSGAEVNVLPYTFTRQMKGLEIFQINRKLTSYTGHEIKIKGIATLNCKTKNKTESLEFFIADGYYQPILGIEAIENLSLIKKCDAVQTEQNNSAKEILNRHKNIFEGIGRLPIEHKIRLKENATPVIAPSRKIPFSIREKVKAELERMEKLDIIEKLKNQANGHTLL